MLIQNIISIWLIFFFAIGIAGCHEIFSYVDSESELLLLATLAQIWGDFIWSYY